MGLEITAAHTFKHVLMHIHMYTPCTQIHTHMHTHTYTHTHTHTHKHTLTHTSSTCNSVQKKDLGHDQSLSVNEYLILNHLTIPHPIRNSIYSKLLLCNNNMYNLPSLSQQLRSRPLRIVLTKTKTFQAPNT